MNEINWLKNLKSEPVLDVSGMDVSRAVLRDIRTHNAALNAERDQQDLSLGMRVWAAVAGIGAVTSVGVGIMAFDVWQSVFGPSADLFTFWDVVMR